MAKFYLTFSEPKLSDSSLHLLTLIANDSKKDIYLHHGNGGFMKVEGAEKAVHIVIFGLPYVDKDKIVSREPYIGNVFGAPELSGRLKFYVKHTLCLVSDRWNTYKYFTHNGIYYVPFEIIDNPEQDDLIKTLFIKIFVVILPITLTSQEILKELALKSLNSSIVKKRAEKEEEVLKVSDDIKFTLENLTSYYKMIADIEKINYEMYEESYLNEVISSIKKLSDVDLVEISYLDGECFIYFTTSYITIQWENTIIPVGKFGFLIPLSSDINKIRVYNISIGKIKSLSNVDSQHPHLRYSHVICLGDMSPMMAKAFAGLQFSVIANLLLIWVKNYNPESKYNLLTDVCAQIGVDIDEFEMITRASS